MSSNAHRFEGKNFLGYLVALEVFDQSPRDGTNTWLVWNTKLDRAELWRSCDLSRILRTNGKVKQNKCRYNSYWALGPKAAERGFMDHEYTDGTTPWGMIASRIGSR